MQVKKLFSASIFATAAACIFDVAPSKAVLVIEFIPTSNTRTRILARGSLDLALLPTGATGTAAGANTTAPTGNNSSRLVVGANDQLRFTYDNPGASNPGRRWAITGSTNPFTGSNAAFNFVAPPTPSNNPFFILRPVNGAVALGGQDFWLPNTYITNTPFSGFFDVDASLADIGLLNNKVFYTIGGESIVLQVSPVPGPLPIFGAAVAFGYSRKMRKRIRKPELS